MTERMTECMSPDPLAELINPEASALVLVDYQQRLMPAIHDAASVLAHAVRLADIARVMGVPVIGTEQNPHSLGPNEPAIRERCGATLAKMHFDACADGLVEALRALRGRSGQPLREVVIAGCEAHVCLMQTALGLLRAGLRVWVVEPACGSRRADDRALGLRRLERAGATCIGVEMVAFEWLRSCEHERFKALLPLLKTPIL
ncbi:isochorismatase family protein [Leptothrix discophora]|uniref:Isochorismatase family protein n=2 Tax=Leptothrix discophora TaxID=89 RepID=A0ABT9FYR7_LEPDI|nr:isochorismatase family protein [Leptothrix discophora]